MAYTRQQIARYLVALHHLSDETALAEIGEIPALVQSLGCLQYDPLDPVGRNADLVLQSRCGAYRRGGLERFLYRDRVLFDVWDKNMAIAHVGDWPYFARLRAAYEPYVEQHRALVEQALDQLKSAGPLSSAELVLEGDIEAPWMFGRNTTAKSILELLFFSGRAAVYSKTGSRRYFCAVEDHIPAQHLAAGDPNAHDDDFFAWFVLRRLCSVGALFRRASDAFLGLPGGLKAQQRERAFDVLLERRAIAPLNVEGLDAPLFIPSQNQALLDQFADQPINNKAARILAPLDNLVWDRRLIQALFDFDYKWEVYVPAAKRRYGYYVLPVLCGEQFVGRIELATNKPEQRLLVKGFWSEPNFQKRHRAMLTRALKNFSRYNYCGEIEYLCEV